MNFTAFILAAGLGTRLRPLTNDRPKALVEVNGRTLLEINLRRVIEAGAGRVVVNAHHFGEQVIDFVGSRDWGCEVLVSDERDLLLDTGGGLKKAQSLLGSDVPILVHNVDILSRVDLADMVKQYADSMSVATLAVSDRNTSRYLLFEDDRLVGWHKKGTAEYLWSESPMEGCKELAFSGIAVVSPRLIDLLPEAEAPYSIIPEYVRLAKSHAISAFHHSPGDWLDVGKPETLAKAAMFG